MKKLYSILFLLFLSLAGNAQYKPILDSANYWTYTGNVIPVAIQNRPAANSNCFWPLTGATMYGFTDGDTMISGMNYQRLYSDIGLSSPCHRGYVREDSATQRFYFIDQTLTPERLLYDFSMIPGDSIYVAGGMQFDYFPAAYYYLDSIGTYPIASGLTRIFYLHQNLFPFSPPLIWIEGVGFPGELIYDESAFYMGFGLFSACQSVQSRWYDYEKILTCFSHDMISKVYLDSCAYGLAQIMSSCFNIIDSCNYYNICGSVHELGSVSKIKLNPNPVSIETTVEIEGVYTDQLKIDVIDVNGKLTGINQNVKIISGTNTVRLNVESLKPGVYIININGKDGSMNERLIKL